MSATTETPAPRNDVERLLQDMIASGTVVFSLFSGDGYFSVNLTGTGQEGLRCDCHADLWITRTSGWTLYARLGDTQRVRFVRESDPHVPNRESLSIRLIGPSGQSTLRGSFAPLYDDREQPLAAPFARWEALRAKYGGQDEVRVENGALVLVEP
jgi:hypothetical protein